MTVEALKNYRLKDDGYPTFKKIMRNKEWIGRVTRQLDGSYTANIGKVMFSSADELTAFVEVSARHLGYADASALIAGNAKALKKIAAKSRRATKRETVAAKPAPVRHKAAPPPEPMNSWIPSVELIRGLPETRRVLQ